MGDPVAEGLISLFLGQARSPPLPGPISSALKQPPLFISGGQTNIIVYVCYDFKTVEKHRYRASVLGGVEVRNQISDHPTLDENSGRTTFLGKRSRRKKVTP